MRRLHVTRQSASRPPEPHASADMFRSATSSAASFTIPTLSSASARVTSRLSLDSMPGTAPIASRQPADTPVFPVSMSPSWHPPRRPAKHPENIVPVESRTSAGRCGSSRCGRSGHRRARHVPCLRGHQHIGQNRVGTQLRRDRRERETATGNRVRRGLWKRNRVAPFARRVKPASPSPASSASHRDPSPTARSYCRRPTACRTA